jgi:hypothetical protein
LKGVKLTTLQKLGLGKVEDAASGTPITHGARLASVKSYNVEQGNRALGYIGESVPKGIEPGTELNNHIDQTASNFYSRLSPKINGTVDSSWPGYSSHRANGCKHFRKEGLVLEYQGCRWRPFR